MLAVFQGIVAIAEAFPIIDGWLRQFFIYWAQTKIAAMKQEDKDTVLRAIIEHNQIDIERLLGYSKAGEPTGVGDIVNSLPGV